LGRNVCFFAGKEKNKRQIALENVQFTFELCTKRERCYDRVNRCPWSLAVKEGLSKKGKAFFFIRKNDKDKKLKPREVKT